MRSIERLLELWKSSPAIDEGRPPRRLPNGSRAAALRRVDERLRRDLASAVPEPPADLAARIALRVRSERPPSAALDHLHHRSRSRKAWLAAGLAAAALLACFWPRPEELVEPAVAVAGSAPPALALREGLQQLLRPPLSLLRAGVDAPLLDQARLLAGDGERVARALVERLPSPLRAGWSAPPAE